MQPRLRRLRDMTHVDELAALLTMSPSQLRSEWRRVLRAPPPDLTPDLLRRGLAYRLQERRHGGLTTVLLRDLVRLAARLARGEALPSVSERQLKPGTRLQPQGIVNQAPVCAFGRIWHLRRSGRSHEPGTGMRPQCFLTRIKKMR